MSRPFMKMHGLGNDFVMIDGRADGFVPDTAFCLKVADRHRGVGCDQIIVLGPPKDPAADFYMTMFNADSSIVRACGNGTRCAARLFFEETGRREATVQTVAGLLKIRSEPNDLFAVDFGPPHLDWQTIPLARAMDTLAVPFEDPRLPAACLVNVGNPHAVFFVDDVEALPLDDIGPRIENHALFPDRTNVELAQVLDRTTVRMRVWERGAGITSACGSGASATAIAAIRRGLTERRVEVRMDGGALIIEWREADSHTVMTGPASLAFRGEIADEMLT